MTENKRYYVEEIINDKELFVDKSDVADVDKLFYVIHDKYAFEDYPVMITSNYSLAWKITDRLNMYEDILDEQDVIMKSNGLKIVDRDYLSK